MTALPAAQPERTKQCRVECDHCGLVVPAALVDDASEQQFCCNGCRVAYETIHGCGLQAYYEVRDRLAESGARATGLGQKYASFDSEAFQTRYVTNTANKLATIDLRLEGVHCAACVWLVEHLPRVARGVVEARLSLASATVRLTYNPDETPLSEAAAWLDRLGYAPHPARDTSKNTVRTKAERTQLVRMAIAGALAGNNMLIALALYAGAFDGIESKFAELFRWLSMGIGWLSLLWPGRVFFRAALAALRTRTASLDLPISLALGVGGIAGTANVLMSRGDIYFDSLSVLVFLLLAGRFIQARQQRWAQESIGLALSLAPDACRVVRDGDVIEESVEALAVGDEVEVRAGDLFPADGVVSRGESSVDQAILTGESLPRSVREGDPVHAGVQNLDATLRVNVTAVGDATRIGQLMRLVDEGLQAKAPLVQFADRVAGWFIVVVASLAAVNFAAWSIFGSVAAAVDTTVALLIVACPCALGLATPLTMAIAIGRASRRGVLIKSADVLQRLASGCGKHEARLMLDKTGTLTEGAPRVVSWHGDGLRDGGEVRPYVAAAEAESSHPIAAALVRGVAAAPAESITARTERQGYGIQATCPLGELRIGSMRWMQELGILVVDDLRVIEENSLTSVAIAIDNRIVAIAAIADGLKSDAAASVAELEAMGWQCEIVSGDARGPAMEVARAVGIAEDDVYAPTSPEQKLAHVRQAVAAKQDDTATIVMVGDGVNDAAALAAADVGIAVHGGAEAALAAADVYMRDPGLSGIARLVRLGERTMQVAHRNLAISLTYNVLAVTAAAAGFITPLVAAVLMPISSTTVLASAIYGLTSADEITPPRQEAYGNRQGRGERKD